jgi:hypothetical protein
MAAGRVMPVARYRQAVRQAGADGVGSGIEDFEQ